MKSWREQYLFEKYHTFNTENGLALFLIARVMADAQIQSFGWGQNLITLYL